MSGPKELRIKRELTHQEFSHLSSRLVKIADKNNYVLNGNPRKSEDRVELDATHRFKGTKISLSTRRKETTMGVFIEDSDSCEEIMNEVVDAMNETCPGIVDKWTRVEPEKKKLDQPKEQKEAAKKLMGQ